MENTENCLNCGQPIDGDERFCPQCGQKNTVLTLNIRQLLSDFLESILTWDNRFGRTLKYIFKPNFLAKSYLAGKRVTYLSPFRILFYSLILFLFITRYTIGSGQFGNPVIGLLSNETIQTYQSLASLKTYRDSLSVKPYVSPGLMASTDTIIDYLEKRLEKQNKPDLSINIPAISIKYDVNDLDAYTVPLDTIIKREGLTKFSEKLVLTQLIKMRRDPRQFLNFLVGKISWLIILLILFSTLNLKLLYFRQGIPYVEHLVWSVYTHSSIMLFIGAGKLMALPFKLNLDVFLYAISMVIFALSMHKFYQQSPGKSFVKLMLFGFGYFLLTLGLGILLMLTGFLLFGE